MSCDDPEDDEEYLEAEMREQFPNYLQEDFGEFVQADLNRIIKSRTKPGDNSSAKACDIIEASDYKLICANFIDCILKYYSNYYHNNNRDYGRTEEQGNGVAVSGLLYELRMDSFRKLFDRFKTTLDMSMDRAFYPNASLLVASVRRKYGEANETGMTIIIL